MDQISEDVLDLRPTTLTARDSEVMKILAKFLAKNFIARSDVKAIQRANPIKYNPVESPWTMANFVEHFTGKKSYGHYLLNKDDTCKIFVMDIDLKQVGNIPTLPIPASEEEINEWLDSFKEQNVRDAWLDRSNPARTWIKTALRQAAGRISAKCAELDIPTITAYTGSKGLHVYGLMSAMGDYEGNPPAEDAYELSHDVLEELGYEAFRGNVFFRHMDTENLEESILEIEAFPKQVSINNDGYGNLVRLPYGINLKSPRDKTFFIDETRPLSEIYPASIRQILSTVN